MSEWRRGLLPRFKVWSIAPDGRIGDLLLRTGSEEPGLNPRYDVSYAGSTPQLIVMTSVRGRRYAGSVYVKNFDTDQWYLVDEKNVVKEIKEPMVRQSIEIVLVHWVIEEYEDGNDPPEPWGWYEHPSDQKLEIGQLITLKTLDGKPHHDVKINRIDGSTLYVGEIEV